MLLRIISAEWELYLGEVQKVGIPTNNWILWILPGHMNLVTPLISGLVTYLPLEAPSSLLDSFSDHTNTIEVGWGLAMIENDMITIAVE
jgi:F0F1-type ATP synthase epsilon subunit